MQDNVEVRIQNNFKIPQPPKIESQNEIPPNVIRIETQDGSGEFIEIEFNEENQEESQGDNVWDKTLDIAQEVGRYVVEGLDIIGNMPTPYAKAAKSPKLALKAYKAKMSSRVDKNGKTREEMARELQRKINSNLKEKYG